MTLPLLAAGLLAVPLTGFFAGTSEGLWHSPDGRNQWKQVGGRGPQDLPESVGSVHAILPIGPHVLVGGAGGLYLSEDWGRTWQRLALDRSVLSILTTRSFPADPTLLAGTVDGLFRSPDGGRTFAPTSIRGAPVPAMVWPGPSLLLAAGREVLRSEDGGGSFAPAAQGLPPGTVRAFVTSSYFTDDPVAFAAVEGGGVLRSRDGARNFTATAFAGPEIYDLLWLGRDLYASGEGGVFRSEDAGTSWKALGKELAGLRVFRLLFPSGPGGGSEAVAATSQGVFRTPDAGWHWAPSGLAGHAVFTIATFPPAPPGGPSPTPR